MITVVLIFISGLSQAIIESIHIKFYQSIFYRFICWKHQNRERWWNAAVSWKNKYKNGATHSGRKSITIMYIKFPIPSLFYSATDLFRFISFLSLIISIPFYSSMFGYWHHDFMLFFFIWNSTRILFKSIFLV